jgi:saccharopine dehydrogenase-like NADP-dependent oxidoreductase
MPLEGYEEIVIDGIAYEAFNTSGGLGTLCDNLNGNIRKLDYKTMRYKGHHQHMVFLLKDLNLANRKEVFVKLFDEEIPKTRDDVVIVYVKGVGRVNGVMTEKTYVKKIYGDNEMSAIQRSTSFGVCAVVDLWDKGIMKPGFVCQENVSWKDFTCNEWGNLYNFDF